MYGAWFIVVAKSADSSGKIMKMSQLDSAHFNPIETHTLQRHPWVICHLCRRRRTQLFLGDTLVAMGSRFQVIDSLPWRITMNHLEDCHCGGSFSVLRLQRSRASPAVSKHGSAQQRQRWSIEHLQGRCLYTEHYHTGSQANLSTTSIKKWQIQHVEWRTCCCSWQCGILQLVSTPPGRCPSGRMAKAKSLKNRRKRTNLKRKNSWKASMRVRPRVVGIFLTIMTILDTSRLELETGPCASNSRRFIMTSIHPEHLAVSPAHFFWLQECPRPRQDLSEDPESDAEYEEVRCGWAGWK